MSAARALRLSRALEIGVRELERRALDPSLSAAEQFRAVDLLALLCNDPSVATELQIDAADALREIPRADNGHGSSARNDDALTGSEPAKSRSEAAATSVQTHANTGRI